MPTVIAGFSSNDRRPGAFGEVLFGTAGQSAAGAPLAVLCVGLMLAAGNLRADTEIRQVFSTSDIDAASGTRSELGMMASAEMEVAPNVPLFLASPTPPVGAVAASTAITISGTWTNGGQLNVRVNGKTVPVNIAPTDTPALVAASIASAVNGALRSRLPMSATSAAGVATLTWGTPGVRGNQAIVFIDTSALPSGCSASLTGPVWVTTTAYAVGAFVTPTVSNGYYYKATVGGTGGASQPTWPTTIGTTVTDGTVTWTCWGQVVTGGGVTLGGGSGLESYTNLLSALSTAGFKRIALAANDSVSDGVWKAQIDNQAAAPTNILQQVLTAQNGLFTAATSLAQTTLNDQRFEVLWGLNSESHPAELAARFAGLRAATESQDPGANYNNKAIPGAAPMSQKADWPSPSVQIAALNAGVTPLFSTGDGSLYCLRAITSHSLLGSAPDYSAFDTAIVSVADFCFDDVKLYWNTVVAPANRSVSDNPLPGQKEPSSGIITPAKWASTVQSKYIDYSNGIISGTGASPSIAPILLPPQPGDIVANFDGTAKRIMLAATTRVAPNNAQVGNSIRPV